MKRTIVRAGLAAGAIGAGVRAKRRFAHKLSLALTTEPAQVPLLVPVPGPFGRRLSA